jgi:hypothetical protein
MILTGGRAVANILPITLNTLKVKKHTTAIKYSFAIKKLV